MTLNNVRGDAKDRCGKKKKKAVGTVGCQNDSFQSWPGCLQKPRDTF